MTIRFKHACYAATALWTSLGILEIWDIANFSGKWFATFGLLTLASIVTLWMKDK